jgi:Glucodextranase, domain B
MLRTQKKILIFVAIVATIAIISYIAYTIWPTIKGPSIDLLSPQNGEIVEGTSIIVKGETKNIAKIYMNGSPINLNKNGYFETKFAIYAGSNILVIEGYDRYGRKVNITRLLGTK